METHLNKTVALEALFAKVTAQQNMRGIVFQDMTPDEKLEYASQCAHALSVEVAELSSSWPFAPWKTNDIDIVNIEREIIDCIFFLVNISNCFGISPTALIRRFDIVLENNNKRIENGTHKPVVL